MTGKSHFEEFAGNYIPLYKYKQVMQRYPEGKGEKDEIIQIAMQELLKSGATKEDLEENLEYNNLAKSYERGDRRFFTEPVTTSLNREAKKLEDYVSSNLEGIFNDSPDEVLREKILPYVLEKKEVKGYEEIKELHDDIGDLEKKLKGIEDPKTREEVVAVLRESKAKKYEETYSDENEDQKMVKRVLINLIDDQSLVQELQKKYSIKSKELNEKFNKDIKGFISAAGLTSEEVIGLYEPIFLEMIKNSKQKE